VKLVVPSDLTCMCDPTTITIQQSFLTAKPLTVCGASAMKGASPRPTTTCQSPRCLAQQLWVTTNRLTSTALLHAKHAPSQWQSSTYGFSECWLLDCDVQVVCPEPSLPHRPSQAPAALCEYATPCFRISSISQSCLKRRAIVCGPWQAVMSHGFWDTVYPAFHKLGISLCRGPSVLQ
jgi:hypothetical protein